VLVLRFAFIVGVAESILCVCLSSFSESWCRRDE
jgi:hypothetical protein